MAKAPYKLQLTNGYFVDFGQIGRLLAVAVQHQTEARIPTDVYTDALGIAERRVENIGSLCAALGLLRPSVLTATPMGKLINQFDPYLDNLGTLWLLHYVISSDDRYVVWNRLVNRVIPENERISTAIARRYFDDLVQYYSASTMDKHLRKEISSVWNAYTEQAFAHLDYVRTSSEVIYIRGAREPVPPRIFLAAVLLYCERYAPRVATLDVPVLAGAPNSPGRVFALTDRQVRDLLDAVQVTGGLYVESRADLDQVRFRDDLGCLDTMRRYYEER